MGISEALTR